MGMVSWSCWHPKADDRSKRRQSASAGRTEERVQSRKGIPDRRKENAQTSQSWRKAAGSCKGVPWYERLLTVHTEPALRGQAAAKCGRDQSKAGSQDGIVPAQIPRSERPAHKASGAVKVAAGSTERTCKKDPVSPSKGLLIKAVPQQRVHARQEGFQVETSWLAVADVSFADMLQVVDLAAKRDGERSRPCPTEDAATECKLVFPKLKGRVSDSGCRPCVSKKTAVTPINSPRPPSKLGVHPEVDTRSNHTVDSQPAARSSPATCSWDTRPCKAAAVRAKSDASRPTRAQQSAGISPDKHQHLIQRATLAQLPSYAERPSRQAAVCAGHASASSVSQAC